MLSLVAGTPPPLPLCETVGPVCLATGWQASGAIDSRSKADDGRLAAALVLRAGAEAEEESESRAEQSRPTSREGGGEMALQSSQPNFARAAAAAAPAAPPHHGPS